MPTMLNEVDLGVTPEGAVILGKYTGIGYPFSAEPTGVMSPKPDISVLFTSIANILTTPKGSLPYDPDAGSFVPDLVFEIADEATLQLIRHFTEKDLREQERRIVVVAVYTEQPDDEPNQVVVTVGFSIVGDPSGQVYSAPVVFVQEV